MGARAAANGADAITVAMLARSLTNGTDTVLEFMFCADALVVSLTSIHHIARNNVFRTGRVRQQVSRFDANRKNSFHRYMVIMVIWVAGGGTSTGCTETGVNS